MAQFVAAPPRSARLCRQHRQGGVAGRGTARGPVRAPLVDLTQEEDARLVELIGRTKEQ